jgi:hypothetical protein
VLAFKLDVNYEEEPTEAVVAYGCISSFVVSAGIDQAEERVKEHFSGALERNAVVRRDVGARLVLVPDYALSVCTLSRPRQPRPTLPLS